MRHDEIEIASQGSPKASNPWCRDPSGGESCIAMRTRIRAQPIGVEDMLSIVHLVVVMMHARCVVEITLYRTIKISSSSIVAHHFQRYIPIMSTSCATCATSYSSPLSPLTEKPLLPGRQLPCCDRSICARCLNQNKRYETYCPYCQITTEPSLLPQVLRDPPAYEALKEYGVPPPGEQEGGEGEEELPEYSSLDSVRVDGEKGRKEEAAPDVLHFLTPEDSMRSLALAYGVPINALRKANNVFSDHLIQARRTVLIPGEFYKGGVSLSPQPPEGEEEEIKRSKVRRWMMACKVAE